MVRSRRRSVAVTSLKVRVRRSRRHFDFIACDGHWGPVAGNLEAIVAYSNLTRNLGGGYGRSF
jgi:hypothetical protein